MHNVVSPVKRENSANTPASVAAAHVIGERLVKVAENAELLLAGPEDEIEAVHQLRVWSRRTDAAVKAFAPWLSNSLLRRLTKKLRGLRRHAGKVRDLDVLLADTKARLQGANASDESLLELRTYATAKRAAAVDRLRRKARKLQRSDFFAHCQRQLTRLGSRAEGPALAELSRRVLARRERRLLSQWRQEANPEERHRLRIAGKKLRYAIEIFSECLVAASRDEALISLRTLQDELGAISDHFALASWIDDHCGADIGGPAEDHRAKGEELLAEFNAVSQIRREALEKDLSNLL